MRVFPAAGSVAVAVSLVRRTVSSPGGSAEGSRKLTSSRLGRAPEILADVGVRSEGAGARARAPDGGVICPRFAITPLEGVASVASMSSESDRAVRTVSPCRVGYIPEAPTISR